MTSESNHMLGLRMRSAGIGNTPAQRRGDCAGKPVGHGTPATAREENAA